MYDFDRIIDRRGTNSYKWDACPSKEDLPLWVADMDFAVAPCIQDALRRRMEHPIYGYVRVPDSYYNKVIEWFARRHQFTMKREWIIYTIGVVPGISACIQALTRPGDKVLVQTPVYNCFFSSILNSGCEIADSPLLLNDGRYEMDFADLEEKAADPSVKIMLLCNPHNPAGRAWSREDLKKVADICLRHDVFIVCDEIHNELTLPGTKYTCLGTLGDEVLQHAAILTSSSKSFNIAGLQIANITVADEEVRQRIDKAININEVCDVNPFGVEALQAAYTPEGEQWLTELMAYIDGNYRFLRDFFAQNLPQLPVIKMDSTYLPWVDCSVLNKESEQIEKELLEQQHVWFNAGQMYAHKASPFLRINIACPRSVLQQALERFRDYVRSLKV